jgi:hypothetical protein
MERKKVAPPPGSSAVKDRDVSPLTGSSRVDPKKKDDADEKRDADRQRQEKKREGKDDELPPPESYPPVVEYDD